MDDLIKSILVEAKNVVIVGVSSNSEKDSYIVMKYLQERGIRVIPVNPQTTRTSILGEKVYKDLDEVDIDIDIVDIFRPSSEIFELVNKIINKKVKTVWLQLDIFCTKSEKKLNQLGINFIQNKCTKIEYEKITR
jgi:predicted CoA-binding protein